MFRTRKSILFVRPDFHASFFYRREFRKLGWKADIYAEPAYPAMLLYSTDGVRRPWALRGDHRRPIAWINQLLSLGWYLLNFWRYRYHVHYGRPGKFDFKERHLGLTRLFGADFSLELALAKLAGCRLVYMPTGCNDTETQERFNAMTGGTVCSNCGSFDRCIDRINNLNFARIRRYFDLMIGNDPSPTSQYPATLMRYKVIDLDLWSPSLEVPPEFRLPAVGKIRVLHSSALKKSGRAWQGRDIKGSAFVLEAIERLKSEGFPVEYFFIEGVHSSQMRFYQAQADIIVEQLRYGWHGSTGVETLALGKPVVCYINPDWKRRFLQAFPEHGELPFVEATTETIYEVLKELVTDEALRRRKGAQSRRYAELQYDPASNTRTFAAMLESL